jgi:hypothetical protein
LKNAVGRRGRDWNALCHDTEGGNSRAAECGLSETAYVNGLCERGGVNPPEGIRDQMNEQDFQTKLAELMGEISTLPPAERRKLEQLATETRVRHERLRQTVGNLQESLDYLRLSIKYLVFDLEATRRENGYLRKMLDEATKDE